MLTIYVRDGTEYTEIPIPYNAMIALLEDNSIIGPDDFIELK